MPRNLKEFKLLLAPDADWGPVHMKQPPSSTEMHNIKHQSYSIVKTADGSTNPPEKEQLNV